MQLDLDADKRPRLLCVLTFAYLPPDGDMYFQIRLVS